MEAASAFKEGRALEQLPLDAPLMSTRRSWSSSGTSCISRSTSAKLRVSPKDASQRVPFSWERSPGVPKEARKPASDAYAESLPWPPKLPPSRWRPAEDVNAHSHDHGSCGDGNDGDIDISSNDIEEEADAFSDALDGASFCEKFDMACRLSSFHSFAAARDPDQIVHRTPSFIMNRFLPAAHALASSSAHISVGAPPPCSHRQQKESRRPSSVAKNSTAGAAKLRAPSVPYLDDQTESPSKSCGLMLFFPWSLKPTVCGFKSPSVIRSQTPRAALTSIRAPRCTGDGGRSNPAYDEFSGTCVSKPSARDMAGFLDTSRLRIRGRDAERWIKAKGRREERGERTSQIRRNGVVDSEDGGITWSLPQLRSPSESWLVHALHSANKRFY